MNESTTPILATKTFTGSASLAAIGLKLAELKLFEPIAQRVQIAQKTVKDRPSDKLYDALISILAGAHGLVEINTRLRADVGLQRAFGRSRCAEQSVVQDTLNACTPENVKQMEHAMESIYRQHSQGYQHDYQTRFQVLDVDRVACPAVPKRPLPPKATLPNSETDAVDKWAACWPATTAKSSWIVSLMARHNGPVPCNP
jgi:hypothetical protein